MRREGSPILRLAPSVLPVDAKHQLAETAARVVRVARVRVGAGGLEDRRASTGGRDRAEVDVVEQIQHLDGEFEASGASQADVLGEADVEPREPRRPYEERPRRAVARLELDAPGAVGRRDVL